MEGEVVISERRIDWLTGFARNGAHADALEEYVLAAMASEVRAGAKQNVHLWEGFSGEGTAHLFTGRRSDGVLVRLQSHAASDHYGNVLPYLDHVSRIDYCVTVYDPSASINPADDIWELGQHEDPLDARLPTVTRTQQRWGGTTTYLGKRASAVMGRVYDKCAQSGGDYAKGSWRFELELKRHASEQEAQSLMADSCREDIIPDILARKFADWGCLVPWRAGTAIELWRTPPRISDLDRTAGHLGRQYGKTARRFVEAYGIEAFLKLFGIDDEQSMNGA